MERRIASRRTARVTIVVDPRLVVVVGLVASGLGVALPRDVAGDSRSLYWFTATAGAVLFVGLLVLHGLAQAVALGRRRGEGVTLQLRPFGGVPKGEGKPSSAGSELRMGAAGLGCFLASAAGWWSLARVLDAANFAEVGVWTCGWLARLSAVLAVVQLLPVVPLAAGRLMRALLWRRYGDRDAAIAVSAFLGQLTSGIVIGAGTVAFVAGAFAEGLLTFLTGWMLLEGDRSGDDGGPVTVAEVMTRDAVVVPGWLTLAALFEDYRNLRSSSPLAVQRFSGEVDAVVSWVRLARVPQAERSTTRVFDVARPIDEVVTARPNQALSELAERLSGGSECRVLVLDHGRVVGRVALSASASASASSTRRRRG